MAEVKRIRLLNDQTIGDEASSSVDGLGFQAYAHVLSEVAIGAPGPFTVGIFGEWGTGKTSLLRLIEDNLGKRENVITVWFNAWRYEGDEQPIVPLIATIIRALETNQAFLSKLNDGGRSFLRGLRAVAYGFSAKSTIKVCGDRSFIHSQRYDQSCTIGIFRPIVRPKHLFQCVSVAVGH